MINIHHFDEFTSDPAAVVPKFCAIWRQIADALCQGPRGSRRSSCSTSPRTRRRPRRSTRSSPRRSASIRKTNPSRTIVVGPGLWNGIGELSRFRLPDNDLNLIATVHCYDPFHFTHQGATGRDSPDRSVLGIVFPGPPETPLVPDPT